MLKIRRVPIFVQYCMKTNINEYKFQINNSLKNENNLTREANILMYLFNILEW